MGEGQWGMAKRGRPFARHCTLLVAAARSDECVKCKLCYGEITVESARPEKPSAIRKEKPGKKGKPGSLKKRQLKPAKTGQSNVK